MKSEWGKVNLGDVCDLIPGFAFKSKDFGSHPTKVVKIGDIQPPRVAIDCLEGVNLSSYSPNKLEKYLVTKGDFVLAMTGATIGKLGRFLADKPAYINQRVLRFKPKENVDWNFIYYVVNTKDFSGFVYNHIDSETAQPNISAGTLATFSFSIPPLPIQRKIASILSSLDDKIETNNAICRNLEEQAMALYKSWFVDFEPFGGIAPDKWEKGVLGDFISCNPQLTKGKYMGTFIDMKALPTSGYRISTFLHKIKATGTKFQNGDVLMARITPCLENGKTGIVWGLEEDEVGRGSTEFIVLRGKEAPLTSYIACLSRDDTFRDYAIKRMNGSSGRQRVQASDIIQYPILVPSKEVLCRFENTVSSFFGGIKARSDENDYLSKLRDTLLPKLMSGELSIDTIN